MSSALLIVASIITACSQQVIREPAAHISDSCSIGPRPTATASSNDSPSLATDGPLLGTGRGSSAGASGWIPSADFVVFRTDLDLENRSEDPITLDSVVVGPPRDPTAHVPRLLGCFVIPTRAVENQVEAWTDFHGHIPVLPRLAGYRVPAHTVGPYGFAPKLALLVAPNGPMSYTSYVVIAYHTPDAHEYATVYQMTWLLCVRGEAPNGCPGLLDRLQ